MPTFLTTRKMSPALAARVEASVRGRRSSTETSPRTPLVVACVRLGLISLAVASMALVVSKIRRDRAQLERARFALIAEVSAQSASLTEDDTKITERLEPWLFRLAAATYEGDLIADELRSPGAASVTLARPSVYLRGPIDTLTSSKGIEGAASDSVKDAFLLCLVDPPDSRAEKPLLAKARAAYSKQLEALTPNVRRLHDAQIALPVLDAEFQERIRTAPDLTHIDLLRQVFEAAPVERGKRAAKAELLIALMDETGAATAPTELDGERAHDVRIALIDLPASKLLLRLRRHVDPSWIAAVTRPTFARGVDSCALGLDVHNSIVLPTKTSD